MYLEPCRDTEGLTRSSGVVVMKGSCHVSGSCHIM